MGRNYLCVPFEYFLHDAADLTDAEFGRLVRGMYRYFTTGETITPEGNERFFIKGAMADQDNFRRKYEEVSQKRREAGKKGANNRWQAMTNDSKCQQMMANDGDIVLGIDISNSKSLDIDNTKKSSNTKEERKEKEKKEDADFDRFWKVYPNKKGKGVARTAFQKAKAKVSVDVMISAVENQKRSRQWMDDGGRYIPHPATWLNQERWDDNLQVEVEQESNNGFLELLREMDEKEGVIANGQEADGTSPFDFESGVSELLPWHG